MPDGFAVGAAVEVRFQGKTWRPAVVTAVREEGSYDVEYEGGEKDMGMPPPMVRAPTASGGALGPKLKCASNR